MPLKFSRLFALEGFTFLLDIYLAIKFKESLIFFASDAICLMELCNNIG